MPFYINPDAPKATAHMDLDESIYTPFYSYFETDMYFSDVVSEEPIRAVVPGSGADYDGNIFAPSSPHVANGKLTIGGQIENRIPFEAQQDLTAIWLRYNVDVLSPTSLRFQAPPGQDALLYLESYTLEPPNVFTMKGSIAGPDTYFIIASPARAGFSILTSTPTVFISKGQGGGPFPVTYIGFGTFPDPPSYVITATDFQLTTVEKCWYKLPDNFSGTVYPISSGSLNYGHYWPLSPSLKSLLSTSPVTSNIEVTIEFPFVLEDFYLSVFPVFTLTNYKIDILSCTDSRGMLFLDVYYQNVPSKILYSFLVFSDGVNRAEVPFTFDSPFVDYYIKVELEGQTGKMRIGHSTDGETYIFGDDAPFLGYISGVAAATQVTVGWDEPEFLIFKKITIY